MPFHVSFSGSSLDAVMHLVEGFQTGEEHSTKGLTKILYGWIFSPLVSLKDGLPYLDHSFRNKYFNKISLGNMLYFQNKL